MAAASRYLRAVVCMKQVPDGYLSPDVAVQIGLAGSEDILYLVDDLDLQAIERTVQLKESNQVGEIVVVSLGPKRVEEALRVGLAMGADRAIHVLADDRDWSAQNAASVLARVVGSLGYDLILCGQRSSDGGSASVGPAIAEHLSLVQLTDVDRLEISRDLKLITARRRLDRGLREVVKSELPVLVTVADGLTVPRYVSMRALKRARRSELERLTLKELGCDNHGPQHTGPLVQMVACTPPRPRPKPIFVPGGDTPVHERIRVLLAGAPDRGGYWLRGEPADVAEGIVKFLAAREIPIPNSRGGRS
jgi:electron transfer flavoprotein beta subunit